MGRPLLTLQEWCNQDQQKKLEFIQQEIQRKKLNQSGTLISSANYAPNMLSCALSNGCIIQLSTEDFEKLKARYRIFKKSKKDHGLIKKQYQLRPEIAQAIKSIQEQNSWSREEAVIEHVMNIHLNRNTVQKTKAQLDTKPIKLKILQDEINKNSNTINNLITYNTHLKQQIDQLLYLLAKAYLVSDHYKDLLQENSIEILPPNTNETVVLAKKEDVKEVLKLSF